MKQKTFDKHVNRCEVLFRKWRPLLLPGYKVRVRYHRSRTTFEHEAGGNVTASTDMWVRPFWEYMTGQIHVSIPDVRYETNAQLEYAVVHELVHIMLHEAVGNPTNHDECAHIERVTTMIARALLRVQNGGKDA